MNTEDEKSKELSLEKRRAIIKTIKQEFFLKNWRVNSKA